MTDQADTEPVHADAPDSQGSAAAAAPEAASPMEAEVIEALQTIFDPEIPVNIYELGLIYGIDIVNGTVNITMTLTAPGCPVHDVMPGWIRQAVSTVPGVLSVDVRITFDPPWTPERIKLGPQKRGLLG